MTILSKIKENHDLIILGIGISYAILSVLQMISDYVFPVSLYFVISFMSLVIAVSEFFKDIIKSEISICIVAEEMYNRYKAVLKRGINVLMFFAELNMELDNYQNELAKIEDIDLETNKIKNLII